MSPMKTGEEQLWMGLIPNLGLICRLATIDEFLYCKKTTQCEYNRVACARTLVIVPLWKIHRSSRLCDAQTSTMRSCKSDPVRPGQKESAIRYQSLSSDSKLKYW